MNTYLVQYAVNGSWVPFHVKDTSIHTVIDWVKSSIQEKGICVSLVSQFDNSPVSWWDTVKRKRPIQLGYR